MYHTTATVTPLTLLPPLCTAGHITFHTLFKKRTCSHIPSCPHHMGRGNPPFKIISQRRLNICSQRRGGAGLSYRILVVRLSRTRGQQFLAGGQHVAGTSTRNTFFQLPTHHSQRNRKNDNAYIFANTTSSQTLTPLSSIHCFTRSVARWC
jgi:hypothetical protein